MTRRSILIALACVFFAVIFALALFMKGEELFSMLRGRHDIFYDGSSFSPSTLTIPLGTTVTFINKSTEPFWPASNLHPSHLIYPEFDPKQPIAAGGSWSFTFNKVGDWGYHNHVKPTITGAVNVLDQNGKETGPLDCTIEANKQSCWQNEIETALDQGGIDSAFNVLSNLYATEPGFKQVCHDMTHKIGERAYSLFSSNTNFTLSDKTTYCGYGFFHGFIQTLLTTSGDLEEARKFCTFVNQQLSATNPSAWDACYHGIGHGVIDGSDPRTWGDPVATVTPGLELCVKVASNTDQKHQCANGVFNALSIAYTDSSYGLHMDPAHAYDICATFSDPDFKFGCYEQMNPIAARYKEGNMADTLTVIDTIQDPDYKGIAIRPLAGSFAHEGMTQDDYKKVIDACYTVDQSLRERCIVGVVTKLIEFGPMGHQYDIGIPFCNSSNLQEPERSECFSGLIGATRYLYLQNVVQSVCASISAYTDTAKIDLCQQNS